MRVSTIIVVWTKQANKRISHAVMWFVVFVCYVPGAPLLDDDALGTIDRTPTHSELTSALSDCSGQNVIRVNSILQPYGG